MSIFHWNVTYLINLFIYLFIYFFENLSLKKIQVYATFQTYSTTSKPNEFANDNASLLASKNKN